MLTESQVALGGAISSSATTFWAIFMALYVFLPAPWRQSCCSTEESLSRQRESAK